MNYFKSLIRNGTKDSSKSFVMIIGVIGILLQMAVIDVLIFISINAKYHVDWLGIAAVFTALATLAAALIWGKVKSESYWAQQSDSGEEETNENTPTI